MSKAKFEAIGTRWVVESPLDLQKILPKITERIELFDKTYSRFRSDSLVTALRKNQQVTFPDDFTALMDFYEKLYTMTDGKVTPLIGDLLEEAGYDARYSLKQQALLQSAPLLEDVIQRRGTTITLTKPAMLDFGAAGKGYIVDIVARMLLKEGINEFVIDASGDILHRGASQERIGLEHPQDPSRVIGVAEVQNQSLCASASNRRTWGKGMHHIFDPQLAEPTNAVQATWVIAEQALIADGLATALFFTEPAVLTQHFSFEYVRFLQNGSLDSSPGFKGELFT